MHIAQLEAFHVRIPLRKPVGHASHTRDDTDSLVVRCRLDDGTEGWGEGLPRPYVTGESIDAAKRLLRDANLAVQFAQPFDGLRGAIERCTSLQLAAPPAEARDCFGHSVRCALEIAILDAACRAQQVPLAAVTQLMPETVAVRESRDRVRYSAAITAMRPFKEVVTAAKIRAFGFEQCKVKVGMAGNDDTATLRRIRKVLGPKVDIRIDANEAWRCADLESKLAPLAVFGITAVEQPVPHSEVDGLAALRPRLRVPVMLDESLCSLSDAQRAIERGLCDLFNIRLSKCGGFLNSLRLAALAHRAGLGYQLGCQVGETGILSAAGRHFAASVGGLRYLEGSYDRFLVRERLTVENLTFGYGGWAPALPGPGLGVRVDYEALRRVTIEQIECCN